MASAIIYIRVSTDEQALKGYSLCSQEERLRKFCVANNIDLIQVISEDYSAKNFKRPAWSALMRRLKTNKSIRPNLLLFTRWDRFSRNTADAYYVISQLQKLCIEIQAIDQPLDMAIPENKVLLAMYIVTAEVENDRRSINVKYGIYKAKQEGRWMGHAPRGYINTFNTSGKKTIIPHEPEATLIKKIFAGVDGQCSIRSMYRQNIETGLRCSLNAFWHMIQNPVYCGKIFIPAMDGNPAYYVKGNHEALVSEEIFNLVQSRLKTRKKINTTHKENFLLILRGFLHCPICRKRLTGSGSKGRVMRYYYYHCNCGYRVRADKINDLFFHGISDLSAKTDYIKIYKKIVRNVFQSLFKQQFFEQNHIKKTLEKLIDRTVKARELFIKGDIDNDDYYAIKSDCENQIRKFADELNKTHLLSKKLKHKITNRTKLLSELGRLYWEADFNTKRKIVTLMFKENLIFDEIVFSNNLNPAVCIIYGIQDNSDKVKNVIEKHQALASLTDFENHIHKKISKIEQTSTHLVSCNLMLEIMIFLEDLAKISISMCK